MTIEKRNEYLLSQMGSIMKRVDHYCIKYHIDSFTKDDIMQDTYMVLMKNTIKFDNGRGILFSTFIQQRINGAIKDVIRSYFRMSKKNPLLEYYDELNNLQEPEEDIYADIAKDLIKHILAAGLEPIEQSVMLRILNGKKYREITEELGICMPEVSRMKRIATAKLKAYYKKMGITPFI